MRYSNALFFKMYLFCMFVGLVFSATLTCASDYQIGVYYFPGWKEYQIGSAYPQPWEKIKPYSEREPKLGWYAEGEVPVIEQQLAWMKQYGINYVVFDWLWGRTGRPHLDHALNAYLQASDRHGVNFAIMWSNHTSYIFSRSDLESLFHFWAQRYMFRDDYLRVDGKPVVFIFSAEVLNKNAERIGMTPSGLLELADQIFKEEKLGGISFIGGVGALNGNNFDYSSRSGYAGFSAYNFHGPASFRFNAGRQMSHSYEELDKGYRDQWQWMTNNSSGLYVVPMTSGWDKRPWGGSKDPDHDNSLSTPLQFEQHLRAAKAVMKQKPQVTRNFGVVCCWNEFGEGSFIEPTKKSGFAYLEKIKKVFMDENK